MLARRRLARRAALTIATVGVVMSAGCHQGSSRGLAHQKLRAVTGIDLPPGATLCFAQGVETGLPRAGDCKPITSGERWRRAGRMQPYDKLPSESWLVNNSALERLRQTIAQHYLARPLRADGSIITTCTDWPFFADGHVHEDIYAPVTITDLTQVYRERAVDVAVAELQAAARQGGLPRRQRLEADFALRLHREIEQRGESSAKIVFIQTNWNGGAAAMARHPELARCIKDADPAAPVVTGVSGFVTYGITNEVSVFKASLLESALAITYGREYGDFVNQAAASIGLRWEHAINKEIRSHVRQRSGQPVFHPLWVQVEAPPADALADIEPRWACDAPRITRELSCGELRERHDIRGEWRDEFTRDRGPELRCNGGRGGSVVQTAARCEISSDGRQLTLALRHQASARAWAIGAGSTLRVDDGGARLVGAGAARALYALRVVDVTCSKGHAQTRTARADIELLGLPGARERRSVSELQEGDTLPLGDADLTIRLAGAAAVEQSYRGAADLGASARELVTPARGEAECRATLEIVDRP